MRSRQRNKSQRSKSQRSKKAGTRKRSRSGGGSPKRVRFLHDVPPLPPNTPPFRVHDETSFTNFYDALAALNTYNEVSVDVYTKRGVGRKAKLYLRSTARKHRHSHFLRATIGENTIDVDWTTPIGMMNTIKNSFGVSFARRQTEGARIRGMFDELAR